MHKKSVHTLHDSNSLYQFSDTVWEEQFRNAILRWWQLKHATLLWPFLINTDMSWYVLELAVYTGCLTLIWTFIAPTGDRTKLASTTSNLHEASNIYSYSIVKKPWSPFQISWRKTGYFNETFQHESIVLSVNLVILSELCIYKCPFQFITPCTISSSISR